MKYLKFKDKSFEIDDSLFDRFMNIFIQSPICVFADIQMDGLSEKDGLTDEQEYTLVSAIVELIISFPANFALSSVELEGHWNDTIGKRINTLANLANFYAKNKKYSEATNTLTTLLGDIIKFHNGLINSNLSNSNEEKHL